MTAQCEMCSSTNQEVLEVKSSKEKIDEEVPMPSLLSAPPHLVKVVGKHIFSIFNYGKAHRCGCTTSDAIIINKDWGYMMKNNISVFRRIVTDK